MAKKMQRGSKSSRGRAHTNNVSDLRRRVPLVLTTLFTIALLAVGVLAASRYSPDAGVSDSPAATTESAGETSINAQLAVDSVQNHTSAESTPNGAGLESAAIDLPVGATVGSLAPDFTLEDIAGETVALDDLAGKPMFISFFHSW